MATTAASVTPPPLRAEAAVLPSRLESQDLKPITNHPSNTPSHSPKLETLPPAVPSPPLFLNSIAELKDLSAAISAFHLRNHLDSIKAAIVESPPLFRNSIAELKELSAAISAFHQCYDDLRNHLDSIKAAILEKLSSENPQINKPWASSPPKPDVPNEKVLQKQQEGQNPPESELVDLCKTMCSRGVRKYLATHLSNLPMLREQVPKALRQAPNPPKLVLECLGKFFLQGSKAFTRDSPMIPAREASILILECYLLMMGTDITSENDNGMLNIDKAVKEEADNAAFAWRKRLVTEGGVAKATQIDARGLLFFVACFGMPALFKAEDIRNLVIAANDSEIVGMLQKSRVLMSKISEIVEEMMKKKKEVDAVDIVYTFRLEERFNPQTILVSFLRESKETWKKSRMGSHGSRATLKEANKKQLAALKSISKCLERHKIDPAKLLPGWQINDKITTLEKDISKFDKTSGEKAALKRKSSEVETSQKPKSQAKRSRYAGHGPQQPKAASHVPSRRNLLDSGLPRHAINYSTPQGVVYGGPGAGLLPEIMIAPGAGAGIAASHGGILSTYAGAHEGVLVDPSAQLLNRGTHPYVWHRDSAVNERYASQPSVGLTSLYRATTSMEGFAGNASSVSLGTRGSASDLYQFADSIAESGLYPSSVPRGVATVPTAISAHHSSYLYQV